MTRVGASVHRLGQSNTAAVGVSHFAHQARCVRALTHQCRLRSLRFSRLSAQCERSSSTVIMRGAGSAHFDRMPQSSHMNGWKQHFAQAIG